MRAYPAGLNPPNHLTAYQSIRITKVGMYIMNEVYDQKTYNTFRQYRFTFVLFVIVQMACKLYTPYSLKPPASDIHRYAPF